jgi:hypothetical protein
MYTNCRSYYSTVFWYQDSQESENKYGSNPKSRKAETPVASWWQTGGKTNHTATNSPYFFGLISGACASRP